jgi:hypothetical protein
MEMYSTQVKKLKNILDKDSKEYRKIFNSKSLSWEEKLNKSSEYANDQVMEKIKFHLFFNFVKSTGIIPVTFN